MQKIIPHLWFDKEAREAAHFYTDVLPDSKVTSVQTITGTPSGDCDIVSFELAGQPFMAISAGPVFKFNPSISFTVVCKTNEEVDVLWSKLNEGGTTLMELGQYPFSERYGWTQDKYGLSWQIIVATKGVATQSISPALMFTQEVYGKAEEAMNFYVSIFKNSKIDDIFRYGAGEAQGKEGTVAHGLFSLEGQTFSAMDAAGEHKFTFNEAISLIVKCENQEEIDYFWERLSADPASEQCGWLKDKYGLSWQITPIAMDEMISKGSKEQIDRVTQAFLKMKKFDIAVLQSAYDAAE